MVAPATTTEARRAEGNPLVSAVIVTHNRRVELRRCLQSVGELTYSPVAIVVVDNASTDGTVEMVRRDYPMCRVVQNAENVGTAAGRNLGVTAAEGQCILLVDDDCAVARDSLQLMMDVMLRNADCAAVTPKIINQIRW